MHFPNCQEITNLTSSHQQRVQSGPDEERGAFRELDGGEDEVRVLSAIGNIEKFFGNLECAPCTTKLGHSLSFNKSHYLFQVWKFCIGCVSLAKYQAEFLSEPIIATSMFGKNTIKD